MGNWTEEKLSEFFAKAFKEVVLPSLDDLANRVTKVESQFGDLGTKMDKVENRLGKIEEKLVKIEDKLDRHAKYYDDHEKRITQLETKLGLSPQ